MFTPGFIEFTFGSCLATNLKKCLSGLTEFLRLSVVNQISYLDFQSLKITHL